MAKSQLISNDYTAAIDTLNTGISKLGQITSLNKKALEIEIENGLNDDALMRLDTLITYSPQKERWLYEKGRLLESLGRKTEARNSYIKAKEYYNSRPPNRRRIPALVEIIKKVENSLDNIDQK